MVRHIILLWLRNNSEKNIRDACDRLRLLTDEIDGLLWVEAEAGQNRSDQSCDICLNMVFDSWASLSAYRSHPESVLALEQIHAIRSKTVTADFAVREPVRNMPRLFGTFGPSFTHAHMIENLVDAGMTGMWLSLSHRSLTESTAWIEAFKAAAKRLTLKPELIIAPEDLSQISSIPEHLGATHVAVSLPAGKREQRAIRDSIGAGVQLLAIVRVLRDFETLPAILSASDGIVIMRDYVSRDILRHHLPMLQARAAQAANIREKPFIVASELLASMREKPVPSAAELSDIHQAVSQGASGLLLIRETAIGKFPKLAMETLRKAAKAAVGDAAAQPTFSLDITETSWR
ncbi:MAG: pyruvate kinase [Clostridia bacterium]|nr:pyruvate kinase [Clostridia bacterium]